MKALSFLTALIFGFTFMPIPPVLAVDLGASALKDAGGQTGAGYAEDQKLETIVGYIIKVVLGLLGIIFLALIIYSGIMWMTSAGEEKKIKTAKDTLTTSVIGLVIVLSAYAISDFVINQLTAATNTGGASEVVNPG